MHHTSVAAIIVTRDRWSVLRETLDSVLRQSRCPNEIIIIDNDSLEPLPDWFEQTETVRVIRTSHNGGYAYGLAKGIEAARGNDHTHYWLMDDDSRPELLALDTLLKALDSNSHNVGMLGQRGGLIRHGNIHHFKELEELQRRVEILPHVRSVEFTLVDGALLSEAATQRAGLPDGGMFMMFEDIEYSWRLRKAGFEVAVMEHDLADRLHLGSQSDSGANAWRQYYLARNQLYWAINSREPMNIVGTMWRLLKLLAGSLVRAQWRSTAAVLVGMRHGLQRKRGLTIKPGEVPRCTMR